MGFRSGVVVDNVAAARKLALSYKSYNGYIR